MNSPASISTSARQPLPSARRGLRVTPSLIAIAAAFPALAPMLATSATVLEFGPSTSYVETSTDFRRTGSATGTGPYNIDVPFSRAQPLSPATGYSGPAFHGGYTFSSSTYELNYTSQRVNSEYSGTQGNDALYFNLTSNGGTPFYATVMSFASVFIFNQAAFETPFQQGSVSVNGFSIGLYKTGNGNTQSMFNPEGRWLIEIAGTYYLSNTVFSGMRNSEFTTYSLSGNDLQSTLWAAYDPESALTFNASQATFSSLTLQDITAVGFYIADNSFQTTSATVGMRLAVSEYQVLSAIPEPGSLTLLGLGLPGLLGYLSARRKRPLPQ